jgi:hypothetical protein
MERRSFFGILFGGLLAKFLPSKAPAPFIPEFYFSKSCVIDRDTTRIDFMDLTTWGRANMRARNRYVYGLDTELNVESLYEP